MAMKQELVLMRDGYDIGIGVASATGSPMALGAVGAVTPPQIGVGGSGTFTFHRIETTDELETELGISADVSAGIGLFSASASLDFSKQCKVQSSSLTLMVAAREIYAFQQMDSPELSEAAAKLVETGKSDKFAGQFGEYFCRGIGTGGRFVGVVRVDTKSSESKTEVDAALSASYGLTVSADVRVHISETLKNAEARVEGFYLFEGGHVTTRLKSKDPVELIDELYRAMDEWTATVRQEPKAYTATLAPYVIALGPEPPNIIDFEHQRDVLIRCAKLRSQTLDKLNLIDFILDPNRVAEFEIIPPPAGPDLPALQAALASDLDIIADTASFAINDVKGACDPVTYMKVIKGVADFKLTPLPPNLPVHTGGSQPAPSQGMFTIPNWQMIEEVNAAGQNPDLNIVVFAQLDETRPAGTIISIFPPAGTTISVQSEITVTTTRNSP